MSKTIFFGTIISLGTTMTTGAYYQTRELIWQQIKDDAIPRENYSQSTDIDDIWGKLEVKLTSKEFNDSRLKLIKEKAEDRKKNLKEWCFNSYKEIYWSWFQKENLRLIEDINKACVYQIKDQLDSKFDFGEDEKNKQEFEKRLEALKKHGEEKPEKLNFELKQIQKDTKTLDQWKKLESWCKKTYDSGYQGNKSNKWKLVELYCKKN